MTQSAVFPVSAEIASVHATLSTGVCTPRSRFQPSCSFSCSVTSTHGKHALLTGLNYRLPNYKVLEGIAFPLNFPSLRVGSCLLQSLSWFLQVLFCLPHFRTYQILPCSWLSVSTPSVWLLTGLNTPSSPLCLCTLVSGGVEGELDQCEQTGLCLQKLFPL